jgi:hypothetical protein
MAQKKSRSTFEKLKREQAVKEKRVRKQERKQAAKLAKEAGLSPYEPGMTTETEPGEAQPGMTTETETEPGEPGTTDEPEVTTETEPGQAL